MTASAAATAAPLPWSESRTLPPPDLLWIATPFEVRTIDGGRAVIANRTIARGADLFGADDWADEEERRNFTVLTPARFNELAPNLREAFLRFAYNSGPDQITGTFRAEAVKHPVNFINHSCEPNAGYDGEDRIVALTRIAAGEEIRMDYGTFSFSFDHEFACRCGGWNCRGRVRRDDWIELARTGLRLPTFMWPQVSRALFG